MSTFGKILLYIALVGGLADVGAAYVSYQKFVADKHTIDVTTNELNTAKGQVVVATKKEADAEAAEAAAKAELADTSSKLDDMTAKLTAAEKTITDTNTALALAQTSLKTAQDQLDAINTALGGKSPADIITAYNKAVADAAADASEVKLMQDQLQAAQDQVTDLKKDFTNMKVGYIPPGVSGKVTFVNHAWNFVVLNVGLNNAVVPNGELYVYRGNDLVGKIRVTSAESSSSVGDILPDAKGDIQVGDNVVN